KDDAQGAKAPKRQPPMRNIPQFRLIVLLSNISETPPDQLTENERKARDRIRAIGLRALQKMTSMTPEDAQKLNEDIGKEADGVKPEDMERFLTRQFREHGSLDVTELHYLGRENKAHSFDVTCQARPDAVRTWPHHLVLFFGAVTWPADFSVGHVVYFIEKY